MTVRGFSGVTTDRIEYSRYSRNTTAGDLGVVVATARGVDADPDDALVFTLVNQRNHRVVARKVVRYDPELDDEESCAFDLETDCLDEFGLCRAIRGPYRATVAELTDPPYTPPAISATSAEFAIRLVTVRELRDRWLFGIRLKDERRLVADGTRIAGVSITDSEGVQEGGYPLRYTPATGLLEFGGEVGGIPSYGPGEVVTAGGEFTLWNDSLDGYLTAQVDASALPIGDTAVAGYALLRYAAMSDEVLAQHLDYAAENWQNALGWSVPLEPTTVGTDIMVAARAATEAAHPEMTRLPFDRVVAAQNWLDPKIRLDGPRIKLPGRQILKLHEMVGYYNTSQVFAIDSAGWYVTDKYSGTVAVVPTFAARLPAGPLLAGFLGVSGAYGGLYNREKIENFWQFSFTHGLRDLFSGQGAVIREAIARTALCAVYLLAARGTTGIYASESFNRDGVSLQRNYTGGQLGAYSAEITAQDNWVKENLPRIRNHVVGILVV